MEKVLEAVVSLAAPVVVLIVAAAGFAILPDRFKDSLRRRRGVLAAGILLLVATATVSLGIVILVSDDHFGAATPKDAYVVGPSLIVLGLAFVGFAMVALRNNPVR